MEMPEVDGFKAFVMIFAAGLVAAVIIYGWNITIGQEINKGIAQLSNKAAA